MDHLEQHGVDAESISHLAASVYKPIASMVVCRGDALKATKQWQAAIDCYSIHANTDGFGTGHHRQALAGKSECLRELGMLDEALVSSQRVVALSRRPAKAHQPLALTYKAMGKMEEARKVVNRAIFYEEPWNPDNKDANIKLFDDFSTEIRAEEVRREMEVTFLETWGRLLEALDGAADSSTVSWADVKKQSYDIFAEEEGDDDLRDGGGEVVNRSETAQRLQAAAVSALTMPESELSTSEDIDAMDANGDADTAIELANGDTDVDMLEEVAAGTNEEDFHDAVQDEEVDEALLVRLDRIKLTNEVLKWLKHSDSKFRGIFVDKLEILAAVDGIEGRKNKKRLVGFNTKIFETYLEQRSGQRILWTLSNQDLIIWYVAKHDNVTRLCNLIDNAESRSSRQLSSAARVPDAQRGEGMIDTERILLDPLRDVPLKLFALPMKDVKKLSSESWRPPLHLTIEERDIVEKDGTVLLLGRSGTGTYSLFPYRH